MSLRARIAILGAGRAGCALYDGLRARNHHVSVLWTRSEATADAARIDGFPAESGGLPASLADADLVFLAVSDDAVKSLAAELASSVLVKAGAVYAHLAGSLDLTALGPLASQASIGSLHPLVSIASRRQSLQGAYCAVDAVDVRARARLEGVAKDLGMSVIRPRGDRARYHAAACMVGNYPQVLMESALKLLATAGLSREEARAALGPLLLAAARNAIEKDGKAALSGPIVRGDTGVVERHLKAMAQDRRLARVETLYRAAGAVAAEVTGGESGEAALRLLEEGDEEPAV